MLKKPVRSVWSLCRPGATHLHPSPFGGQVLAQDHVYVNGCTSQIKSAYFLVKLFRRWEAHYAIFFSTRTSRSMMRLSASSIKEINHTTATSQLDVSYTLPSLEDSGFSVIPHTSLAPNTSVLSGNCVSIENSLLICNADSSGHHTGTSHTADSEHIFESLLWDVNHIINIIKDWRPFLI